MAIDIKKFGEIGEKMEWIINVMVALILKGHSLSSSASGGKDSTCTTLLMIEAVRRVMLMGRPQPQHFITSSDTLIENPSMHQHQMRFLEELSDHFEEFGMPITVKLATPNLASQFVVSTIGRGTLIRIPENSHKKDKEGTQRQCSDDWKVKPQARLQKEVSCAAQEGGYAEVICILGTRFEESDARRANMEARGENALTPVRDERGILTLSPIADWDVENDVGMMLGYFNQDMETPFTRPVARATITRMIDLYRSANGGSCGLGMKGKAACGSRFGCAFCCISGDKDKSMEAMIQDPDHAHLEGLNRFRNYLMHSHWDMSKRELVGRTVSDAGYLKVEPDAYGFDYRMQMLKMLLTLDVLEEERAEKHESDLLNGRIPYTQRNRELCEVQFQMISPVQLIAIDFQLSLHHYAPQAFPALSAWYEIKKLGRRLHVPMIDRTLQKVSIPKHGWIKVGNFDAEVPTDGLRDYNAELWGPYRHPERALHYSYTKGGERICYTEFDQQMSVDPIEANLLINCTFDQHMYQDAQFHTGIESARFWLDEGILKISKTAVGKYQTMARRAQYFASLMEKLNLSPREMDARLLKNAITDKEHQALLGEKEDSTPKHETLPLFAAA